MKMSNIMLVLVAIAIPSLAHGQVICPVGNGRAPVKKIVGKKDSPAPCVEATSAHQVVESSVKPFVVTPDGAPDAWLPRIAFALKGSIPKDGHVYVSLTVGKDKTIRHVFDSTPKDATGVAWYRFANAKTATASFTDAPAEVSFEIGIHDAEFDMDDVLFGGEFRVVQVNKAGDKVRFDAIIKK